ncbi:hypothetical protein RAC89_18170 [Paenibacillus sp. GD4]|jgi:hypothetical protein|uniref:hypothetical protein n=1 Tax=Paenibacillus sp. GD4 TaxID=3068890 RepID=UPI002796D4BA|nr:hypothetical protein [Paenibacillus sp. GD4]MDQ1912319.1 hypothetical protein [Paenibacillus sp. GD4]
MKHILSVASRVNGAANVKLINHVETNSGSSGIDFKGKAVISNISTGETVSVIVDGREVLSANADGTYTFQFRTSPRGFQETVNIGVSVTNEGVCDMELSLNA